MRQNRGVSIEFATSAMGQTRKCSLGVDVFRLPPKADIRRGRINVRSQYLMRSG
jgi:hypothetical protein